MGYKIIMERSRAEEHPCVHCEVGWANVEYAPDEDGVCTVITEACHGECKRLRDFYDKQVEEVEH